MTQAAEPGASTPAILEYLSALSGVLGAFFAAGAIVYASRQANAARRDLAHERRMDFELGILAELSRQFATTGTAHLRGHLLSIIREEHDDKDLSTLRAALNVRASETGRLQLEALRRRAALDHPDRPPRDASRELIHSMIAREIDDAIALRLKPVGSAQAGAALGPICPYCNKRVINGYLPEHMILAHSAN